MTSYEDIADLPYAPCESDFKDPEYMGEPSIEWDDENIAAIRAEFAVMCDAFGSGCGGYFGDDGICGTCGAVRS